MSDGNPKTSTPPLPASTSPTTQLLPLASFKPDLQERAWSSVPHPHLPLLITAHGKSATVFSLSTLSSHSSLTGGHTRSVRCAAWKPGLPPHKLCAVTGSFDASAGVWRWDGDAPDQDPDDDAGLADDDDDDALEQEVTQASVIRKQKKMQQQMQKDSGFFGDDLGGGTDGADGSDKDWEFTLVLEGHDSEIKSCAFSPSGAHLATCSRDKSIWIWEDVGASETDDEWETIAVLTEHEGDVKCVAWCPDLPGRNNPRPSRRGEQRQIYGTDVLASASYDNTVRIWREDGDAEWVCVAVLEGHEGTVWGVQWEGSRRDKDAFPRLLSWSADGTVRVWALKDADDDDHDDNDHKGNEEGDESFGDGRMPGGFGGIPNTMRRSLREEWVCQAVLPKVHEGDVYSATWSAKSGLVASTGSDGTIVLYEETAVAASSSSSSTTTTATTTTTTTATATINGGMQEATETGTASVAKGQQDRSRHWRELTRVPTAHGPYELNHVAWCTRFDPGASDRKGQDEMLVSTGDEGIVQAWELKR